MSLLAVVAQRRRQAMSKESTNPFGLDEFNIEQGTRNFEYSTTKATASSLENQQL
jgi:hypothetical protein